MQVCRAALAFCGLGLGNAWHSLQVWETLLQTAVGLASASGGQQAEPRSFWLIVPSCPWHSPFRGMPNWKECLGCRFVEPRSRSAPLGCCHGEEGPQSFSLTPRLKPVEPRPICGVWCSLGYAPPKGLLVC